VPQLRRIIYTTNAIESLHAQVRSAPKATSRPSANSALMELRAKHDKRRAEEIIGIL